MLEVYLGDVIVNFVSKLLENYKLIFIGLLLADLLILFLHLLLSGTSTSFHLDFEGNVPTLYQSAKLIIFGSIFLLVSFLKKLPRQIKFFILPLAAVMLFIGLDELLEVHENSYRLFEGIAWLNPSELVETSAQLGYHSSLWLLYYLPIILLFVIWCSYWLKYFHTKHQNNFWIVLSSAVLLGVILVAEVISSTGDYTQHIYFWLVTIEETAEMFLATVLILGGLKVLNRYLANN